VVLVSKLDHYRIAPSDAVIPVLAGVARALHAVRHRFSGGRVSGMGGTIAVMRPLPSRHEMERAFLASDGRYEGVFVTAVRTTGIFCRPSCPARKPLPRNVEFFATPADALRAGYRACLRCRPLEFPDAPDWLARVTDLMDRHPGRRVEKGDLQALGVEPERARREFRKRFGMTLAGFSRARRLGRALDGLHRGDGVDDAVFESGFESHSGFREAFRRLAGRPPGEAEAIARVSLAWIDTPLGRMLAGATDTGICLLEFTDRPMLPTQMGVLRQRLGAALVPGSNPHLERLREELSEYFAGARRDLSVPIVAPGTPFEERVWSALRRIPHGETRTYQELARALGSPDAQRAVGRANGMNRIAIVIPCHRVVAAGGGLGGYGGGLWRKRLLLHLERTGQSLQDAPAGEPPSLLSAAFPDYGDAPPFDVAQGVLSAPKDRAARRPAG
jgi:AraC family transcriptional regulator of adaptative response/methylated-DNA-[protein]-cysteine methyltransferase